MHMKNHLSRLANPFLFSTKPLLPLASQSGTRPHQVPKVKMTVCLASYAFSCNFNVKVCNRLSTLRGPLALNRQK